MKTLASRLVTISFCFSVIGYSAHGLEPLRVVALSESVALETPLINGQGLAAFIVAPSDRLRGASTATEALAIDSFTPRGIYAETSPGKPELIVDHDQQVPGAAEGTIFGRFLKFRLNYHGDMAFWASTTGGSGPAIFGKKNGEPIRLIARSGPQTIPFDPEAEIGSLQIAAEPYFSPSIGINGRVSIPTTVHDQTSRLRLLQETSAGTLNLVNDIVNVTVTVTVPTPQGISEVPVSLDATAWDIHHINTNIAGDSVYYAELRGPADRHISFPYPILAIVKTTAAGENQAIELISGSKSHRFYDDSLVAINTSGDIAFVIQSKGYNLSHGIYRTTADRLVPVVLPGDVAPNTDDETTIRGFGGSLWLNDQGETLYLAGLHGPSTTSLNDSGLFLDRINKGSSLVLREDDPAPGTEDGVTFDNFNDSSFAPTLNNVGQVAFSTYLRNTDSTSDFGIWAQNRQGELQLIAREGDELDVSDPSEPADLRTIQSLYFLETEGNGPAYGTAFNDRGQLAFSARFTDGSYGVFVSNAVAVPEPMSIAMLGGGLMMAVAFRDRRHRHG